ERGRAWLPGTRRARPYRRRRTRGRSRRCAARCRSSPRARCRRQRRGFGMSWFTCTSGLRRCVTRLSKRVVECETIGAVPTQWADGEEIARVSDDQNWQPPVEPSHPASSTPFGAPTGPGASGVSQGAQGTPHAAPGPPPGAPAPAQGWTPPPKPGLIPLRPLQFSEILGASFRTLRRNPKPTYGAALIVYGVTVIATAVIAGLVTWSSLQRLTTAE